MDQHAPQSWFGKGLKEADFEAWRSAYAQFGSMVYRLARGMVGTKDAEDVAQEAFLQAFRKRDQFRGESAREFECWIYRITLNKCRDWRRARQTQPVFAAVADWGEIGGDAAPVGRQLDERDLFEAGLQGVQPSLRSVLLLHIAGRSYQEIGKILKIKSKGTVSEKMGLAREQLREALARLGWTGSD